MELGVDCGGTKTEAAVIHDGTVVDTFLILKPATKQVLFRIISAALKKHTIDFIGIGFPAPVVKGVVSEVMNIPEWNGKNVIHEVEKKFKIPCAVDNDANCFALAEARISGSASLVGITLGTGLGIGIVHNTHVIRGEHGAAGELGRLPYNGKTLEDFTSKKFFLAKGIEPIEAFKRAQLGRKRALQLVSEYGKHLGIMTAMVVLLLEPKTVVFAGNISNSFEQFKGPLMDALQSHIYTQTLEGLEIRASVGTHVACRGAALLKYSSVNTHL